MSKDDKAVHYLKYDGSKLIQIGCMKCNDIVAKTNPKTEKLVYWSHYKHYPLKLEDGSYQNVILCHNCYLNYGPDDFKQFDKTRRWGWKQELIRKSPNLVTEELADKMVDSLCESKKIIGKLEI